MRGFDGQPKRAGPIWIFLVDQGLPEGFFRRARETRPRIHIMLPAYACGFVAGATPKKGGAVADANSDNSYLPNHPESEEVDQKACRKTNRTSQNLVEPNAPVSGTRVTPLWGILSIFERAFRGSCSDPAWFGRRQLSEFGPAIANPFSVIASSLNPQAEESGIIWPCASFHRVCPRRN